MPFTPLDIGAVKRCLNPVITGFKFQSSVMSNNRSSDAGPITMDILIPSAPTIITTPRWVLSDQKETPPPVAKQKQVKGAFEKPRRRIAE